MITRKAAAAAVLVACALVTSCAGRSTEAPGQQTAGPAEPVPVTVDRDADPSTWCGDKPLKIGLADGVGGNAWRKISFEVVRREAAKCPAVDPEILYTNAGGDQQKATSDINGLVSQGVDVLLVMADFGPAQLPALRAATRDGVTVVPYDIDPGGIPGVDYTAKIVMNATGGGEDLGAWVGRTIGKGNIVFLGGNAGAPGSALLLEGIKTALRQFPDVHLLEDQPVVTNWNKVDAQKAVSGLIARYPQIDAVITDYGVTAVAAIEAFAAAGLPIPAIASLATTNELGCVWRAQRDAGREFPLFSVDSTNDMAQLGLRMGVAAANGKPVNPIESFRMPAFLDSVSGAEPPCDPSLPLDADFSSPLPAADLAALLK